MKQIQVKIAEFGVGAGKVMLSTIGLGSCVAIALHDTRACIGALAHIVLPSEALSTRRDIPGKFPSTAIPAMVAQMRALGSKGDISARIVGGSSMFAKLLNPNALALGARNVLAARAACLAHGISVVAEDTGGAHGRSVFLDVRDGSVLVRSLAVGDVSI